jgi:hypothetical protein
MKSHEAIRQAVEEPGVKAVAAALRVSPALVYKWCEPTEDADSGARNPLDRVRDIYLLTRDIRLVRWLCNEAGGFFVANPVSELRKSHDEHIFDDTRAMMREFSEMLDAVSRSVADDSAIDQQEAEHIREKWEDLKAVCEGFVVTCERGHYQKKRS